MTVYGIVAEWHPFHRGHRALIKALRSKDPEATILSVMSGPFSQRGEAALFDKWTRAEAAIAGGVDLLFELHQAWATAGLADFAAGAVATLRATGLVDALAFGSECGDADRLRVLAEILRTEPPALQRERRRLLDQGLSFAVAQQKALEVLSGERDLAHRPNDRLAMHYLAAWPEKAPFHAIWRTTDHHGPLAGSAIRQSLRAGASPEELLPQDLAAPLQNALSKGWVYPDPECLFPTLRALLLRETAPSLGRLLGLTDGSAARYLKALEAPSLAAFRSAVQSRHLTLARIDRDVLQLLAPIATPRAVPYLRLLAANPRGRQLLNALPESAPPLLANPGRDRAKLDPPADAAFCADLLRQDLAALYQRAPHYRKLHRDFYEPPRIIDKTPKHPD